MPDVLDLSKEGLDAASIARQALADDKVFEELIYGISPDRKKITIRENSFRALMLLCEKHPDRLLPHWEYLVGLLQSNNSYSKYAAIHIIAAIVPADKHGLFDKAFDIYYDLLDDRSIMVAAHAAGRSGKIARAKPALQPKITGRLLNIEQTHFDQGRQDLIKPFIIESFEEYFERSQDKAQILAFVRQQVNCRSPKARKLAKAFLYKWEGAEGTEGT
ncbi:MAG: hypothetical protein JSU77_10820 [Fidelibacterota bacterium]|nr:MAG: hypothetical protein JSU77_10820 [Candidatus Neomarinimicrobiota bacterium]